MRLRSRRPDATLGHGPRQPQNIQRLLDRSRPGKLHDRIAFSAYRGTSERKRLAREPRFREKPMDNPTTVDRRKFLGAIGVTVGGTGLAGAGLVAAPQLVKAAAEPPKGKIPDTPYKTGHMTFLTGPAAVLGEPSYKGHILAAEEINAQGGFLGKRKIETITADEAAGTDANVKEMRRMKLSEKIDLFTGVISSGNTPALGPVAEELKLLTVFVDGCTDFLFDKAVPKPKYVFRVTNIQSADGVTSAVGAAKAWPYANRVASIQPDYSYGRNAFDHVKVVMKKLVPQSEVVSE